MRVLGRSSTTRRSRPGTTARRSRARRPGAPSAAGRARSESRLPSCATAREGKPQADEPRDRRDPERGEDPALGQLDSSVASHLEYGGAVDEIAQREESAQGQQHIEDGSYAPSRNEGRDQRAREEQDETDALAVKVEEREAGLGGEDRAIAHLLVVLG